MEIIVWLSLEMNIALLFFIFNFIFIFFAMTSG